MDSEAAITWPQIIGLIVAGIFALFTALVAVASWRISSYHKPTTDDDETSLDDELEDDNHYE